jgi:Fic family protein
MIDLELRPSLRIVKCIAEIERFAGSWDRISPHTTLAFDEMSNEALLLGAKSMIVLDSTSPASLLMLAADLQRAHNQSFMVEKSTVSDTGHEDADYGEKDAESAELVRLAELHHTEAAFDLPGINRLYAALVYGGPNPYRTQSAYFLTPENEVVFPTVSAYMVEQRLADLADWVNQELEKRAVHPLLVIGAFHLLFLQTCPFPAANHRLCLLLVWRLLAAANYSFIRYCHFAPLLLQRSKQYFGALRRAEKTAFPGNWSSLNIWLEFFLDTVLAVTEELPDSTEKQLGKTRLSSVQKRILEVVANSGSATRERVANETGINLSTVKYNLSVLAARGHLKRHGGGRTTSYSVI